MDANTKKRLTIEPFPCHHPEIGRWLWAIQDIRNRTLEILPDLTQAQIDWQPSQGESSIGSVLYHIADIEADWLYVEVLEQEFPAPIAALFPYPTRDEHGRLTHVQGFTLTEHLQRLETVRERLLETYREISIDDYRRPRSLPSYDVSPEWVLHHLMHHEAQHFGQIGSLITRMQAELSVPEIA
ncbi:MAG: DinB family protein [Chloroflexota bacterium]